MPAAGAKRKGKPRKAAPRKPKPSKAQLVARSRPPVRRRAAADDDDTDQRAAAHRHRSTKKRPPMNVYRTYLVTWPSTQVDGFEIPGEWRLTILDDPSFRHWAYSQGLSRFTFEGIATEERIQEQSVGQVRCKEILVEARDEAIATNVASLIQTGTLLGYPDIFAAP